MNRIGFVINPIAGMGGRVGLKGTDGVVRRAVELGARPVSNVKARETLAELQRRQREAVQPPVTRWVTCSGAMGADVLIASSFREGNVDVVFETPENTHRSDTIAAAKRCLDRGVDLILFCGGDGTARDVCEAVKRDAPILGIPSGVKMYSGVFGTSPVNTAEILFAFTQGRLDVTEVEILDLDEGAYRHDEWRVKLYYSALTPFEPTRTQAAKLLVTESPDSDVRCEIAAYLLEEIAAHPRALILLGPGGTVQSIGEALAVDKTFLGIDALAEGKLVGKDLNESGIMNLIARYPRCLLIVSPIGAQGFVLGRGNLQLSPRVVRGIGPENIIVVATPAKLARTPVMRYDTGDSALDTRLTGRGYVPVVTGYRRRRLVKAAA